MLSSGLIDLNEIVRIPVIEYLLVFVFVFAIYGWIKLPVHKIVKRVVAVILIAITSVLTLLIIYTSSSYQPAPEMYDYYDVPPPESILFDNLVDIEASYFSNSA